MQIIPSTEILPLTACSSAYACTLQERRKILATLCASIDTIYGARYTWFCTYSKCNHMFALFDPLSKKWNLAIKILGGIEILLSFVVAARCTRHDLGIDCIALQSMVWERYRWIQDIELPQETRRYKTCEIWMCTASLSRVLIDYLIGSQATTKHSKGLWDGKDDGAASKVLELKIATRAPPPLF